MRKNAFILMACLFLVSIGAGGRTLRHVLVQMPREVLPLLSAENVLDAVDFHDSRMRAAVKNRMGETSVLTALTDTYAAWDLSAASRAELKLLSAGKDTLVFGTLVHGGAGGVCSTANMYPELVCSIYNKFVEGDLAGSLEAQYRLNPVRLSMDLASFPVSTKDMANMMGLNVGLPYRPSLPSDEKVIAAMRKEMVAASLLEE